MPSLVCPDCGQPHALDTVGGSASFRCRGCGRVLKVPERFLVAPARRGAPTDGSPAALTPVSPLQVADSAAGEPDATERRYPADADTSATPGDRSGRAAIGSDRGPRWLTLLIWFLAIPLGAAIVFGAAEMLNVLSSRQLVDTFLESGWDRFGAVARLLPFWALVSAALVHFPVEAIARRRSRRRGASDARGAAGSSQRRVEREPARSGS